MLAPTSRVRVADNSDAPVTARDDRLGHTAPLMHEVLAHAAALLCLVAALVLPGHALERAWLRGADLDGLRLLARIALGIACWMLALFALAALGAMRPALLWTLAAAFAAAALAAQLRFGPARGEPLDLAYLAAVALASAPFWVQTLGYQVGGDAATYHLTLPKLYLAAGGFTPVPISVYAIWPHATELLFALAMALRDYALAGALHTAFGALSLYAVYAACRAAGRPAAGWLAAPLALANPVFLFEMGIAYVDLAYAFFLAAGVVFMARALRTRAVDAGALALAGVCAGALAAIKLNGVLGSAALAALALPRALTLVRDGDAKRAAQLVFCFAAPLLALWLPWLARSAALTGNPVYPFLYGAFGGPDWSDALAAQFAAWQRGIGMGRAPADYALLPLRVLLAGGPDYAHFGGRLGVHWLLLVPLAGALGRREPLVRASLGVSAVYFALWALGSQQMRFLIPLLPLLALACAVSLDVGVERIAAGQTAAVRQALRASVLVLALAFALLVARPHYSQALAVLPALRADAQARRDAAALPVFRWIAASLPPDAKLLLLDANQTFFVPREALADSFFEASQLADWLRDAQSPDEVRARLAARGVTHVLRDRRRDWGIAWPPALLLLLRDDGRAQRRYLSPDGRIEVWELR
jgi:hypothetical protein